MKKRDTTTGQGVDGAIERIREALSSLRFGSVAVTIHEGRVVQIDVTEKRRLSPH